MRFTLIIALVSLISFSCRDGGTSASTNTSSTGSSNAAPTLQSDQNSAQPVNTASSEFHYICVNNCEGSGANAAGNCPVCGEELVHNTAFHSGGNDQSTENTIQLGGDGNSFSSKIAPLGEESGESTAPAPVTATGDASFHYICSAGCGGGGNAQGACPNCGAALEHNAAFHANQGASATPGASSVQTSSGQKFPSVFNSPGAVQAKPIQSSSGNGFHYICSAGCGGGGNAQGACPKCGAELAHNAAFHQ